MHAIRSKARRAAWTTEEGSTNYNPFARTRSKDSKDLGDLENQNSRRRSETNLSPRIEEQRRAESRQAERDFGRPQHADTAPPDSATSETAPPVNFGSDGITVKDEPVSPTAGTSKESSATSHTMVNGNHSHLHNLTHRGPFKRLSRKESKEHEERGLQPDQSEEQLDKEERQRRALTRKIPVGAQFRALLFGSWINVLLLAVPVGFALYYSKSKINNPDVPIFIVNFIAIIPLAGMLSYATEELALRVGETLGGLLNASFGNAVELIVSVQALIKGEITVVKTSLIGSMLSNLLLVLGMSFFLGGVNRLEQHFNVTVAQTAASLLALCIASLIIPTVFHEMINGKTDNSNRNSELSQGTAVILLVVYGCYLFFQLKSHTEMYNAPSQKTPKRKSSKVEEGAANRGIAAIGAGTAATAGGAVNQAKHVPTAEEIAEEEDDDIEEPQLSVIGALVALAFSTTLVAFCSEFMVSSIEGVTAGGEITTTFVGLILLPIVGNAAEHATAVTVAIKDKMDLAIGVAVGSSMQVALLVLPFVVVLGWIIGQPCMTLYFDTFQIAVLFVAVLLVNYLIQDGKSHWLEGVLLMASYIIIAVAAFEYPNLSEEDQCS